MNGYDALAAARDSAYWAAAAALAAWLLGFVGLIVNGVGLLMVWRQLKANQRALASSEASAVAATVAAEMATATARAWISLKITEVVVTWDANNPRGKTLSVSYELENVGGSPAPEVGFVYRPYWTDQNEDLAQIEDIVRELKARGPTHVFPLFPNEKNASNIGTVHFVPDGFAEDARMLMVAGVLYRVSGQASWRMTLQHGYIFGGKPPLTMGETVNGVLIKLQECQLTTFGMKQITPT